MISVHNLSRSFGSRHQRTTPLRDITHTFSDGTVTYLVGLNGTGKSTLLRLLCGVLRPDSGRVDLHGGAVGMMVSTDAANLGHTGRRHLHWAAAALGLPGVQANQLLEDAGLASVANTPVGEYSLGMRQRLGIATALLGFPHNIVLDEPLNGLDVAGMLWLRTLLRDLANAGHCVIVASHHLAEIELSADDVVILEQGAVLAAGTVPTVRGPHSSLEDAFVSYIPRSVTHEVVR